MKNDYSEDIEDFVKECLIAAHEVEKTEALIENNLTQCQQKLSHIEKNSKEIINIFNANQFSEKWTERAKILLEIDICFNKLEIIDFLKKSKGIIEEGRYNNILKTIKPFEAKEWPKEPNDFLRLLDMQEQKQQHNRTILIRSFLDTFKDTNQVCKNLQTILELFRATKPYLNEFRDYYLTTYDKLESLTESPTSEMKDVEKRLLSYSQAYMRYQRFLEGFDEIIEKPIEYELKLYWKFFESFHGYLDEILPHSPSYTLQFNAEKNRSAMSNVQNTALSL